MYSSIEEINYIEKHKLAAVVGPTGAGKSRIAVKVAQMLDAEIISCDSMQIYRKMNIGTAKINYDEQEGIPHYMIDVVDPDESFTVADYQRMVKDLIVEINGRGKIPILVGGTGLYYQVVVDDYNLFPSQASPEIRARLEEEAESIGNHGLHARLTTLDPEAAIKINPNDRKRLVRALEAIEVTGQPFSSLQTRNSSMYRLASVGLNMPRPYLYKRLDERVDLMIEQGLRKETEALLMEGYGPELNSMQALGYAQMIRFIQGKVGWKETVDEIKRDTRRFAKRQFTWFKKDHRIHWLDMTELSEESSLIPRICEFIGRTMD